MPIVSRTLIGVTPINGGPRVWAGWSATDSNGNVLRRSRSKWDTQAAAQSALDAHDYTEQLRKMERRRVYEHVAAGNDPSTFTLTDLTVPGFDQYLLRTFARGRIKDEYDFMINVAAWVAAKNATGGATSIASRLGISDARAINIHDRAERIELTIAPNLLLDEADIDEEIE